MIQYIFFDFNGVIIDDGRNSDAYREIFREHAIDLTDEWYMDSLGMDDRTFSDHFERANKPTRILLSMKC